MLALLKNGYQILLPGKKAPEELHDQSARPDMSAITPGLFDSGSIKEYLIVTEVSRCPLMREKMCVSIDWDTATARGRVVSTEYSVASFDKKNFGDCGERLVLAWICTCLVCSSYVISRTT